MKLELIKFPLDCTDDCTDVYDPVCGTDETTYINECSLNVMVCIKRNNRTELKISYPGKCQTVTYKIIVQLVRYLIKTPNTILGQILSTILFYSSSNNSKFYLELLLLVLVFVAQELFPKDVSVTCLQGKYEKSLCLK